jgi:hypothetical protein
MSSHSISKIVLAGAVAIFTVVPASAQRASSAGHSSTSVGARAATTTRSVAPTTALTPAARAATTTRSAVPTKALTPAPAARSTTATPPAARPSTSTPAAAIPTTTTTAPLGTTAATITAPGTAVVTTSPSTMSGRGGGGGSPPNLNQANPGAQDLATPADPNQLLTPQSSTPGANTLTTNSTTTMTTTGAQILGANGVLLPNAQASTSGALPAVPTANPGEVIATSGGTSRQGATGKNMPTCMAAWATATHITKTRWKEICARTLTEPHI